ncbi:DUF421 domain-containing protein [Sphingobacterium thalpophilum]|uniref:DUF421 domain-containing protein n=1 Tax=Sphingobacterium thalpophilum TaxID=259 RepID=UPI0031E17D99
MEQYRLTDWQRILIGEAPAVFLLEVLFRSLLIFFVLQLVIRGMGKRMAGQLTISEMAVMITLGAIIAAPIQLPDRGLITGIIILGCALVFQRQINLLGFKSTKMEELLQGRETLLVKDGILQLENIAKSRISHQQVFASLRNQGIYNLGEVKRLYLEACGLMSLFESKEPQYGLPLGPVSDQDLRLPDTVDDKQLMACVHCGAVRKTGLQPEKTCDHCHNKTWTLAIKKL